jgi:hypothetical protein
LTARKSPLRTAKSASLPGSIEPGAFSLADQPDVVDGHTLPLTKTISAITGVSAVHAARVKATNKAEKATPIARVVRSFVG